MGRRRHTEIVPGFPVPTPPPARHNLTGPTPPEGRPTVTDGEALRRAVLADPDDDTPRLVYADWLDEHDQPDRAAFIRDQVEAVRADPFGPQARAAADRAARLLDAHRLRWYRPLRGVTRVRFERGFVGHLEVEPDGFVPEAASVFAAEPVQALRLYRSPAGVGPPVDPVFALPELSRVRRLEFAPRTDLNPDECLALSNSPHLAGLRDLSLRGNVVHPGWLADLLGGDRLPELAGLDLADITNLGPGVMRGLERAGHRGVRRLDVSGVVFTSEQLQRVLSAWSLREVEELRLGRTGSGADAGPLFHLDIGWVIPWDRLTVLDLAGQWLGPDGVREIVRKPEAAALRWLGLARNALDAGAARLLADSKHLRLNHLDVGGNKLGPAEVAALRRRFPDAVVVS
ncbi:MAG: hypothetical protein C0501_30815 [Isosphaera sp.]|nr:hypothetical protein [Isosphaera sp.]